MLGGLFIESCPFLLASHEPEPGFSVSLSVDFFAIIIFEFRLSLCADWEAKASIVRHIRRETEPKQTRSAFRQDESQPKKQFFVSSYIVIRLRGQKRGLPPVVASREGLLEQPFSLAVRTGDDQKKLTEVAHGPFVALLCAVSWLDGRSFGALHRPKSSGSVAIRRATRPRPIGPYSQAVVPVGPVVLFVAQYRP